jgi:hypothetical protein
LCIGQLLEDCSRFWLFRSNEEAKNPVEVSRISEAMIYDTKSPLFSRFIVQSKGSGVSKAAGPRKDTNTKFEGGKPGSFEC